MMTEKNTTNILTEKEHNEILNMFPEIIRKSIKKCNNPLDETQILVSLFSNKNVRIILIKETNELGDEDYVSYFHARDIAEQVKYDIKHITHWMINWKVKFMKYNDLKNTNPNFVEINFSKIPDDYTNFINEQDLKKILSKINNTEAQIFQTWISNQLTIMKSAIKKIIIIKHELELKKHRLELANKDKIIENKEKQNTEMAKRLIEAADFYRKPVRHRGKIYIATSPDKQKIDAYKIGRTTGSTEKRLSSMQTSNPDIKILKDFDCNDVYAAEKIIHDYLFNLRLYQNKEYFFSYSSDRCIELVKRAVDYVNGFTTDFDDDYIILQTKYMTDLTKKITLNKRPLMKYKENEMEMTIETEMTDETEMTVETPPKRNLNQEFVDKFIKKTNNKKDYIVWTDLKTKYEEWFASNSSEKLPNTKLTKKYFEDNVFKCECGYLSIKIDGEFKNYRGWSGFKFETLN